MKKLHLLGALALTTFAFSMPLSVLAADKPEKVAADAPAKGAKASKPIPYAGVVGSVDKTAKSFTLKEKAGERTFVVTDKTKIENTVTKKPATLDDVAEGAYVTGSYTKDGETLNAYSVHLGKTAPAPKGKKKAADEKPATPEKPATTDKPGATAPEPAK